jgi:monoamine oxidase
MESFDADVCILGGGVAGLYAAEILGQAGARIILLEARDRLGGRILTEFAPDGSGIPIELGAEFIHGQPPTLLSVVRGAGLRMSPMNGRMYRVIDGKVKPADEDENRLDEVLHSLSESKSDEPFESFIRRANVDGAAAEWATSYVEGFNAADAKLIGTRALAYQQEAEEQIGGGDARRLDGGYIELVRSLAGAQKPSTRIVLNAVVSRVSWKRGRVRVETNRDREDAATIDARVAIITVPISMLQRGQGPAAIEFEPTPPVFADLGSVVMGNAVRLNLLFRRPVWEEAAPDLGFLLSKDPCFPTWWTRVSGSNYLMTAWCAGPKARWTDGKSKNELTGTAIGTLATLFRTERATLESALLSSHHHDWRADPLSCGAYSYVKAGGFDAAQRLALSVENTLWFAGEAMAVDGHWGTVHGAMDSGRRAAEGAARSLKA